MTGRHFELSTPIVLSTKLNLMLIKNRPRHDVESERPIKFLSVDYSCTLND